MGLSCEISGDNFAFMNYSGYAILYHFIIYRNCRYNEQVGKYFYPALQGIGANILGSLSTYETKVGEIVSLPEYQEYAGYLDSRDITRTKTCFARTGRAISSVANQLQNQTTEIAQSESIEILNEYNKIIQQLLDIATELASEQDAEMMQSIEVPIQHAEILTSADITIFRSWQIIEQFLKNTLKESHPGPDQIITASHKLDHFSKMIKDRREKRYEAEKAIQSIDKYSKLAVKYMGDRRMSELQDAIEYIQLHAAGMGKPYLDLFKEFKEHQLFIYRRAERSLEYDEEAIEFFQIFLKFVKDIEAYITEYSDLLERKLMRDKFQKAVNFHPRIEERQKELRHIAGMKDHDQQQDNKSGSSRSEKSVKSLIPKLILTVIIIIAALAGSIFLL